MQSWAMAMFCSAFIVNVCTPGGMHTAKGNSCIMWGKNLLQISNRAIPVALLMVEFITNSTSDKKFTQSFWLELMNAWSIWVMEQCGHQYLNIQDMVDFAPPFWCELWASITHDWVRKAMQMHNLLDEYQREFGGCHHGFQWYKVNHWR